MSKQKGDRNKVVQQHPPHAQNTEIGPGKLNEQNWREIEEVIDNEETPSECVDEILKITLREAYKIYLDRQLLPYTVSTAKDALLSAIEWIFLQRDESQVYPVLQPEWTPDIEPCCASIDNWAASYCISPDEIVDDQSLIELVEEMQVSHSENFREFPINKLPQDTTIDHVSPVLKPVEEPPSSQEDIPSLQSDVTEPKVKQVKKRAVPKVTKGKLVKVKAHNHNELLNKASVSRMSETLSQADREEQRRMMEEANNSLDNAPQNGPRKSSRNNINRVSNRKGRSQVMKDVIFDDDGNIVYIIKLNPEKFPSNRVKVKYQLPGSYNGSDKMEKKRIRYKDESVQNAGSSNYKSFSHGRATTSFALESEEYCAPHFKSMVEVIEPIVGVTVRDSQQVRTGPCSHDQTRQLWTKYADKLKPITRRDSVPTADLPEILQPTMTSSNITSLPPIVQ